MAPRLFDSPPAQRRGHHRRVKIGIAEAVNRAAPDGYTLLLVFSANAINATLYKKLNFNFIRDIAPVASIVRQPQIMLVNPSFPAKTVPQFIAYAKSNPGKITMASARSGTGPHLAGGLFKMMAGVNMIHIPYRGGAPNAQRTDRGRIERGLNQPSRIWLVVQSLIPRRISARRRKRESTSASN